MSDETPVELADEAIPVVAAIKSWPERYFAVIFTAQRTLSDENMYEIMADRMSTLAQQQSGFLGLESVRGDDGIGITVSYWVDRESIRNWRIHAEHLVAQQLGRQEFYEWYQIRIAEVVSQRTYDANPTISADHGPFADGE
jgi:heme-degrading monooxygenase HmoA